MHSIPLQPGVGPESRPLDPSTRSVRLLDLYFAEALEASRSGKLGQYGGEQRDRGKGKLVGKRLENLERVLAECGCRAATFPRCSSQGATGAELGGLLPDAALGIGAICALQRSRDVVWFWCIHYCLDMTQSAKVSG